MAAPKLMVLILYFGAFTLVHFVLLRSYRSKRVGVRTLCVVVGAIFATIPFAFSWAGTDNGTIASFATILLSVAMGLAGAIGTFLGTRLFRVKY